MVEPEVIVKIILAATLTFSAILMGLFVFSVNSYREAIERPAGPDELKKLKFLINGVIGGIIYTSFIALFVLFVFYVPFRNNHHFVIGFFIILVIGIPVGSLIIANQTIE